MGEVIRKDAAADDILRDVKTTIANARAKKGVYQTLCEQRLTAVGALIDVVQGRLEQAYKEAAPFLPAINAQDDLADNLIGEISDIIYNAAGRPAFDPILSIIFPGGITYYTDGSDEEQPERMDLLAELLSTNLHPK